MKKNYIKKGLATLLIAGTGSLYQANISKENNPEMKINKKHEKIIEKDKLFNQKIEQQSSDEIQAPQYNTPRDYCSRYARFAAKDLFEKEYAWDHAWNLRYKDKIVHEIQENDTFKDLITKNILNPGMIVGIKQPDYRTSHENTRDLKGEKAKYTHVILYAGLNDNGQPEFLHQYGWKKEKITQEDFKKYKFTPIEILTTKKQQNKNIQFAEAKKLLENLVKEKIN